MLTVTCAEWCGLAEPRFRFTPLLAFMTVKDVEDADLPRFCRSRSTLVEHTGRRNPNGSPLQPGTSLVSSSRPRIIADDHLAGMHRYILGTMK